MKKTHREAPEPKTGTNVKKPSRARLVVACVALLLFTGTLVAAMAAPKGLTPSAAKPEVESGVVTLRDNDLQYTFHMITGHEALFDLAQDPRALRNLGPERPKDLKRLRTILLSELGISGLQELRAPYKADIERLQALGYL